MPKGRSNRLKEGRGEGRYQLHQKKGEIPWCTGDHDSRARCCPTWSSTSPSEGLAEPAKRKSLERGCPSFLLCALDKREIFCQHQGPVCVPERSQQCHTHTKLSKWSQALRLLPLLSRGWETPSLRKEPSHLLPSESETASETLNCN